MTYTREQIIQALIIIKTTCKEHNRCGTCPFRTNRDECYINYNAEIYPDDWDIIDDENWSAFHS